MNKYINKWVKTHGGPLSISRKLGVTIAAVYHWMSGARFPTPYSLKLILRFDREFSIEAALKDITE